MITADEAEQIAERWVATRSEPASGPGRPVVQEFELGYLVSAERPPGAPLLFGAGRGIIDKETAELSVWPDLPAEVVMDQYRERQARRPAREWTWDRAEQGRWEMAHLSVPATVTNLGMASPLTNERMSARSILGDTPPHHHRLVVDFLHNVLPREHRVRGYDRCSEAAAISDALHATDARRRTRSEPPITLDEVRTMFAGVGLETYYSRELADPLGGQDAPHCLSCTELARHFGFALEDPEPADGPTLTLTATTDRFPVEVAEVLHAAGWTPGKRTDAAAIVAFVREHADPVAAPIEPTDAATAVITEFGGLVVDQDGPGVDLRRRPFTIDPTLVFGSGDTLADLGKRLGTSLFPVGTDGNRDSILAVDEDGGVYAVDHAGIWHLGDTIDAALVMLVTGAQPLRLDSQGTWGPPPPNAPQ